MGSRCRGSLGSARTSGVNGKISNHHKNLVMVVMVESTAPMKTMAMMTVMTTVTVTVMVIHTNSCNSRRGCSSKCDKTVA